MKRKDARERLRPSVSRIVLLVLSALSSIQSICAAEARKTADDRFAEQDIRDASQDLDHMHRILFAELQRLSNGGGGSASDEVPPYLHEAPGKPMDLGDVRIPLTTRYIERERLQMAAAIALYRTEMPKDCENLTPEARQLLDAAVRAKVEGALKCHERQLDRLQSGLHSILLGYEANLLKLKLPSFTQDKMLAEVRAYILQQDSDLASRYAQPRELWQANLTFFEYLDEHSSHAHFVNDQILFDDPADAKAMQELLTRLKALGQ